MPASCTFNVPAALSLRSLILACTSYSTPSVPIVLLPERQAWPPIVRRHFSAASEGRDGHEDDEDLFFLDGLGLDAKDLALDQRPQLSIPLELRQSDERRACARYVADRARLPLKKAEDLLDVVLTMGFKKGGQVRDTTTGYLGFFFNFF
jgi:hypothetical protein